MKISVGLLAALSPMLLAACGGTPHEAGVPLNHRAVDASCSPAPSPAAGNCPLQADCTSSATCTAGTNGRCVEFGGGPANCSCTYDTCVQDSDCHSGTLCACSGSPFLGNAGNSCVAGNCRVDADCGAKGYCSPSAYPQGCGSLGGYYCHTSADQCTNDSDCAKRSLPDGANICVYSTADQRWECQPELFCV